jgi:hypothetical protein
MYTTALLLVIGGWVILRTVRPDSGGQTLVDRILGGGKSTSAGEMTSASAPPEAGPTSTAPPALVPVGAQHGQIRPTSTGQLH